MESKEYITYSRRAKAGGERPQQPLFKQNQFHGYRSTKQWVEEASEQCRVGAIYKAEQQQRNDRATRALNGTPMRAAIRKKDGRGVRFKQENEQSASRLESKTGNQISSLSPAILRKDCFLDSQAVALSPISLNVAAGGRQVANTNLSTKHSPVVAALPQGLPHTQGQAAIICADGGIQTMPSGRDDEGRQVVWCNAAFEADDELRSHKSQGAASAPSNRFSPASSSNIADCEVSDPLRASSLNHKQDQHAWASNADRNPSPILSPEVSFSPAISSASAVAGSSPATLMTKSPDHNSLPHVAQLELEAAAYQWYTPVGSESTSESSRTCARGDERVMDLSKTRRTLAAMPSFNAAAPPVSSNLECNGPGARASTSAQDDAPSFTSNTHGKSPKYFTEVPPNGESAGRRNTKQMVVPRTLTPARSCISDGNGPKGPKVAGKIPVLAGKINRRTFYLPRNSTPKQQRFQRDAMLEADLEADIAHEIEEEISNEILHLSKKLAALHARQETRREGGAHELSKAGGRSCPQTPLRSAPSPCGSDSTKRRGRVVAAKFLQDKNEGPNVKQGHGKSATKLMGFNEGPYLGRTNPPRRSLGTPSRLLTRDKASMQQRTGSPNHMVKEELTIDRPPDSEGQSRGSAGTKVTIQDYVRDRIVLESGNKRLAEVLCLRNLEDRQEWNDRGIGQSRKEYHHPAPSLSIGSGAVQTHYYPEFERKVDWVKTLRSGPLPAAHPYGIVNSTTLDDRFLTQKSERQDIRAWLRENMSEAEGNGEIPSFTFTSSKGTEEGTMLEEVQEVKKTRTINTEDSNVGVTPARSARPSNAWNTPLNSARTCTPNRLTPNGKTTPSRGCARTVPSRYGTPSKATTPRTPTAGSRCVDPKLIPESRGARRRCSQTSPRKRCSKDSRGGFSMRKVSPTTRKGYPGASGVRSGCIASGSSRKSESSGGGGGASQHERGVLIDNDEVPKVERKIFVESESENFAQGAWNINQAPEICDTLVAGGGRGEEAGQGVEVASKPQLLTEHNRDMYEPPSSTKPAKKIFIRCSDLIKDKHYSLVKGTQRPLTGQSVLPSECQDSDDLVFARSNSRTDSSELGENKSRSEETSNVEEIAATEGAVKDCQLLSQPGVQFVTGSIKRSKNSRTPEYDVVYDYESGNQGMSSYLPEDYTLEMMLQYVDTLKREREGLPRIRATKDVVGSNSPRDSGCIKRTNDGERSARYYFKAAGGGDNVQAPKSASLDNEGLSPTEIEGLDLESFWCLVGEMDGPTMIKRPGCA